jgi:D-sedoheptulose 7-phosphate isomerase
MGYNAPVKNSQPTDHFNELSAALFSIDRDELHKAIALLRTAQSERKFVWIAGNGGSAATAEHFANDLVKMAGIKAIALPAQTPTVTAFGNDAGWENMFSHALDVFQEPEDVLVVISCSGRSPNVIQAAKGVRNLIVLTGDDYQDNELVHMRTFACIPALSDDITVQEDIHLAVCHAIAKALKRKDVIYEKDIAGS